MYSLRLTEINHGSGQGRGGAIEPLNAIIERLGAWTWVAAGSTVAALAAASVVPLVGTAEIVAGIVATLAGLGGFAAAGWRRRLDTLPLELAPTLARWEGPLGDQLTTRAWLGRGRRLDRVRFEVSHEGGALKVLAHDGPAIGPCQGVFEAVEGPVTVVVHAEERGRSFRVERRFTSEEQISGRFQPGFTLRKGHWHWDREGWSRVRGSR